MPIHTDIRRLLIIGAMTVAIGKVHGLSPIWNQEGGPELPLTNSTIATAVALSGPGRYSLDRAFGVKVPRWITALALILAALSAYHSISTQPDGSGE